MLDGGYLLHSQLSSVKRFPNYGKIAKTILRSAMKHPSLEIHVLLDTYQPDSLKTCEGGRRGNSDQAYIISGPEQKPSQSTNSLLKIVILSSSSGGFFNKSGNKKSTESLLVARSCMCHTRRAMREH